MKTSDTQPLNEKTPWLWRPPLPIGNSPLFSWPPQMLRILNHLFGRGFLGSPSLLYLGLAVATWQMFGHRLERSVEFGIGWIAQLYGINLVAVLVVAGGLHLYFYTLKRQRLALRFDAREQETNSPKFVTGDQVRDNMLWTCLSGVTIWTAFTAAFMWAYANELIPWLEWPDSPLAVAWFIVLLPLLGLWESAHFYFIHRLLHYKPLYRWHVLHHHNINVGPWSGLAMHPLEHVLYFSTILIHLVLATHPVHMFFHLYATALGAVTSHTGYAAVLARDRKPISLGDFHHQLHHRYFDCNYGNTEVPLDKWFGTFHDGTAQATARVRQFQSQKRGPRM